MTPSIVATHETTMASASQDTNEAVTSRIASTTAIARGVEAQPLGEATGFHLKLVMRARDCLVTPAMPTSC